MTQAALIVCRRIFYPTIFCYRRVFDFDFDGFGVVATGVPAVCSCDMNTNRFKTSFAGSEVAATSVTDGMTFVFHLCPAFFDRYGLVMTGCFVVYPLMIIRYRNGFRIAVVTVRTGIGTNTFCYTGRRGGYG